MDDERAALLRADMVRHQLRARGITHEGVLAAMGEVPRHLFVPREWEARAYDDGALPIESGQSISQPYMVAQMTELLDPRPGMLLLEIGTGTGYQAAVLASIGCRVISVERHPGLAETARRRLAELGFGDAVRVDAGDGSMGSPADAPFDGIVVAAAAPAVPPALPGQLAHGGRLVVPVGSPRGQELRLVVRHGDTFDERGCGGCVFVPLIGAGGFREGSARPFRWFGRRFV